MLMLVIFTLRCMGRIFIYTSTARGVPRAPLVLSLMLVTEGGESLTLIPAGPNSTMVWELGWFELSCVCAGGISLQTKDYGLRKT